MTLPARMTEVTRVGDTVHRSLRGQGPLVPEYLRALRAAGFTGAPRWLGLGELGKGVLEYVDGAVPRSAMDVADTSLPSVGSLMRQLHAASRGIVTDATGVLCHNDLAPGNTVFREGRAVAFIDWDLAAPGEPSWDLAHAVWQFALALPGDLDAKRERARLLLDGYRFGSADWPQLHDAIARRVRSTRDGITAEARAGSLAHQALVDDGVPADLDGLLSWLRRHHAELRRWFA